MDGGAAAGRSPLRRLLLLAVVLSVAVSLLAKEEVMPNDGRSEPTSRSQTISVTGPVTTTTAPAPIVLPFLPPPAPVLESYTPWPDVCNEINGLPSEPLLDRVKHLCGLIARGFIDAGGGSYLDVLHALYVVSGESGGDCEANARNWGTQGRVPVGCWSHMSHLWPGRSQRLLGYQIDPMDLYQASLLAAYLVYTPGEGGWYNWWHIHWAINGFLRSHGIPGVYHCPEPAYWQNVRGGKQDCPYD